MNNHNFILLIIIVFLSACATNKQVSTSDNSLTVAGSNVRQKPPVLISEVVSKAQSDPVITLGEVSSIQS